MIPSHSGHNNRAGLDPRGSALIGQVRLLLLDFDGVLTDNRVLVDQEGREAVFVNRGDGLAVSELRKTGVKVAIVSTERNEVVLRRAEKLRIEAVNGVDDKRGAVIALCSRLGVPADRAAFIGNDLNDLDALAAVGLPVCPSDASEEVLAISKIVLRSKGGYGVVREFLSLYREATREIAT